MRLDINSEEYTNAKLKKYISISTTIFIIIAIYTTFKLLIETSHVGLWFLSLIGSVLIFCGYIYFMMKVESEKEPYVILKDDVLICNFKQVPTKQGSFKRKFIGSYESVQEDCNLNIVSHYELTDRYIVAYGYSHADIRELTGFVVERFFDADDEELIVEWLEKHISNIHDPKLKYLLR